MRHIHRLAFAAFVVTILLVGAGPLKPAVAAEPSEAAAQGAVALRVVDEAGAPQGEASVSLFGFDENWRYWEKLDRDVRTNEKGVAAYDKLPGDESYVVRAMTANLVGYRQCLLMGKDARQKVDVRIERPLATTLKVRDESGQPVTGARIWSIEHTGANGSVSFNSQTLEACGLANEISDEKGQLPLPELPPGTLDLRLIHADYAPCEIKGIRVGEAGAEATLRGGVKVTLRMEMEEGQAPVDSVLIDFRRDPFKHPSTLIGRWSDVPSDGLAELTVAAGSYDWLRLQHPDYVAAPIYSRQYGRSLAETAEAFDVRPGQDEFTFRLMRKVKVRGRVINAETGEPMAGESIEGQLYAGTQDGPFGRFVDEWSHAGWGETDARGEYEVELAAGRARVTFSGQKLIAKPEHHELVVAADGSTAAPDFVVHPMPKVRGVVQDRHGQPAARAVVRFRESMLTYGVQPVITDENGRFELAPPWIPEDLQTHEKQPAQTLVAFDPGSLDYAFATVRLDEPDSLGDVVLQMEVQDDSDLINRFSSDLTPWQRGIVAEDRKPELAAKSLAGKPAPELDGAHWLNADKPSMSLADFRGKYVLLQFWTTWCGPCHADMPSIRLLDELYGDKGLVVIGVHDNSMPLEAIEADAAKEKMDYPIVVDHPDGRIMTSYQAHGISGFPSYVLIGPDGLVLKDDETIPAPTLRSFKVEIIRQLLTPAADDG